MRKANYQSVAFFLFVMCIFTGCTRKGSGKIANETKKRRFSIFCF